QSVNRLPQRGRHNLENDGHADARCPSHFNWSLRERKERDIQRRNALPLGEDVYERCERCRRRAVHQRSGGRMSQGFTTPGILDNAVTNAKLRDSAALSVIGRSANSTGDPADIAGATGGHVLQVLSGPSGGFGLAPVGTAVDSPDAPPTGTWGDEEFAGGEILTWRWGNQGSTTQTLHDGVSTLVTPNSTTSIRARWTTPPSGSFSFAAKSWNMAGAVAGGLSGVVVLETGTEAVPTGISGFLDQAKSTSTWGNYS